MDESKDRTDKFLMGIALVILIAGAFGLIFALLFRAPPAKPCGFGLDDYAVGIG